MCMDSFQNCLIVGTGIGYHTCVDLRFRLPITSIVHPHCKRNISFVKYSYIEETRFARRRRRRRWARN